MAGKKLTVVISQSQSKNPAHRDLEETLAAELMMGGDVDVSLVPHLYDMSHDHTGMLFLRSIPGDVLILSWLYPRAARWVLDRAGFRGHEGITLLRGEDEEELDEDEESAEQRGIGSTNVPNRKVYCLDLRISSDPKPYLDEIKRIVSESSVATVDLMSWIQGQPQKEQLQRYLNPPPPRPSTPDVAEPAPEPTKRRWYPVIDYSRCTNCMECIDFCLFGVYGLDKLDRILVEEQDNCKKGCPACSRVCPENAIIFPVHKSPAIAGAEGEVGSLKIDLSQLFGAPSALEMAVLERDSELVNDGRDAVGMTVGIPKRVSGDSGPKDDLDHMLDDLDRLEF
jgi:NAD-dependent dihydropyrimidine dehydrogenase PreA subunit